MRRCPDRAQALLANVLSTGPDAGPIAFFEINGKPQEAEVRAELVKPGETVEPKDLVVVLD